MLPPGADPTMQNGSPYTQLHPGRAGAVPHEPTPSNDVSLSTRGATPPGPTAPPPKAPTACGALRAAPCHQPLPPSHLLVQPC